MRWSKVVRFSTGAVAALVWANLAGESYRAVLSDDPALLDQARLGILAGSLASGIAGVAILARTRVVAQSP